VSERVDHANSGRIGAGDTGDNVTDNKATRPKKAAMACLAVLVVGVMLVLIHSQPDNKATSDRQAATPVMRENKLIVVEFRVPAAVAGPMIEGGTNLPNGTELMISLQTEAPGCQPKCSISEVKTTVENGHFSAGPFRIQRGNYLLEITTSIAELEPASVQAVIGGHGENLSGQFIQPELVQGAGPTVDYKLVIAFGGQQSAQQETSPSAEQPDNSSEENATGAVSAVSNHRGQNYIEARTRLLMSGLKPAPIPRGGQFDQCGINGEKALCARFPELVNCVGMGPTSGSCRMAFVTPNGRFVVVSAFGWDDPSTMTLSGIAWAQHEDTKHLKNILAGKPELAD
jgi:hypothetical protein